MSQRQFIALIVFLILTLSGMAGGFVLEEKIPLLEIQLVPTPTVGFTPIPTLRPEALGVQVERVIDGDTIELSTGQKVRYIGIDTPETVHPQKALQCYGKAASAENKRLVENQTVYLVKDVSETDRYGRLLRYVYLSPEASPSGMVNAQLVAGGFAKASSYPPDIAQQKILQQLESEARLAGRGLWSVECQEINPSSTTN